MKSLIVSGKCDSFLMFRRRLVEEIAARSSIAYACAPDYDEYEVLRLMELKYRFILLPMQRTGMNPINDWKFVIGLWRFIKAEKPDFIFSYNAKVNLYAGLVCRILRYKNLHALFPGAGVLFSTEKESTYKSVTKSLILAVYKLSLKGCSTFIFQNRDDLAEFSARGLIHDQASVIRVKGSGVDLEEFSYLESPTDPMVFLMVARLLEEKGVREYAEACEILKKKYPAVRFQLLGPVDNHPRAVPFAEIEQWNEAGSPSYLGVLKDVRPALQKASVVVLPSYYREGIPRSLLEALAIGRPLITTDSIGCRETVIDGKNGFLIKPRDVSSLVCAMEYFIANPSRVISMGKESRALGESEFDVEDINSIMLKALGF